MNPLFARMCLLISALFCVVYHLRLAAMGAPIFVDDAYYYIIPAQNWWKVGFFSFDGQESTNGFHPLWAWVNALVLYPFQKPSEIAPLISISAVQGAIYLAVIFGLSKALFSPQNPRWQLAWAGPLMLLLYPQITDSYLTNGMESTLSLGVFLFTLWALIGERWGVLSIALALLMLSRLDTLVFVCTPILVFVLLNKDLFVLNID